MSGKHKLGILSFVILFVSGYSLHFAQAAIKDTDVDGLSDDAEIHMYQTDPLVFDTDGDGRGDGDEILDGTNPLDKGSSWIAAVSAKETGLLGNPEQFAWSLGQMSGTLIFVLLTLAIVSGLILSTLAFTRFVPDAAVYEAQRFIFWIALGTVVLYFFSYYFDDFLRAKAIETFIPPTLFKEMETAPDSGIVTAVALGIATFYFLLALIFTSKVHSKISPRAWRAIRYVSFGAYLIFALHSLLAGASEVWWMKALYGVSLGLVLLLVLVRVIFRNILPVWRLRQKKGDAVVDMSREN